MVTSDFTSEVEIWSFRACAMHPPRNSLFIVNLAISSFKQFNSSFKLLLHHESIVGC